MADKKKPGEMGDKDLGKVSGGASKQTPTKPTLSSSKDTKPPRK